MFKRGKWHDGNSKFNGNPDSNFHAGKQPNRNELLARRSRADEQMEADLLHKYGIQAQVQSYNDRYNYGVRITVPNYSSAMTVQSLFAGEKMTCTQESNSWVITLTE